MQELVDLFTVERVNSSPARFDMKKLEAINGDKIRALTSDKFLAVGIAIFNAGKGNYWHSEEIELVKRPCQ
jgi:glutamyl-tRNA synthetase